MGTSFPVWNESMLMVPRTTMQLVRRCRLYHGGIASTAATTSSSSSTTTQIAAWIFADSPLLTEAIATLSYDAIIIDNQHFPKAGAAADFWL